MWIPSFGITGILSSPFTVLGAIGECMIMAGLTIKRNVTCNGRKPGKSGISRNVVVRSSFNLLRWKPAHAVYDEGILTMSCLWFRKQNLSV